MYALVEGLRTSFNQKYADNAAKGLYDPRDVTRLMASDKYAEAFVRHQKGITKNAADMCHRSFKWRKEVGINDMTDASFPEDILTKGGMFFRNFDKDENPIMYFRIKEHKKNPSTLPIIQKYMIYLLDREDKRQEGRQVVILFDMTGAGVTNLDLDLIKFLITCFEEYFPDYLAYLLVFDMPWILNTAWKIIKAWLSEEARQKVVFVRGQEIFQHIDKENLFVHMGGSDSYTYKYEPVVEAVVNGMGDAVEQKDVKEEGESEEKMVTQNHVAEAVAPSPVSLDDRKHVTFSKDDPTVYTSIVAESDLESDPGSPAQKLATTPNNFQIKPSPKKTPVAQKDDSMFVSSLITICPGSDMIFTAHTTQGQKEAVYQCVLVLTNPRTDLRTAYKVKTTTPERYKVRPSLGLIKPGQTTEVVVYVIGSRDDVCKDKFMVMAMEVEDGFISTGELAELWKTVNKSKINEHRLRCTLVPPLAVEKETSRVNESTSTKITEMAKQLTELSTKMNDVLETNKVLETEIRYVKRSQKVMMILLFCFALIIIVTTYHRLAHIERFARNRSSAFTCLHP